MHTTNYQDTFIEVAPDCKNLVAKIPEKDGIAKIQFDIIQSNPYRYTSDDILFMVFSKRNGFQTDILDEERRKFFSKGQACFRASPLPKTYGWGVHSDANGKIALYSLESSAYKDFVNNPNIKHLKAMRSSKK